MPLAIDASKDEPSLADMQQSALSKLERNKRFLLMVEGASIDKSAHSNDITGVMSEMEGFEKHSMTPFNMLRNIKIHLSLQQQITLLVV